MGSTKRDAICEAALELFAEQGIEATTTREIAQRAGAAEGTIYRHFQGKTALVDRLFEISAERFHDALRSSVSGRTGPRSRLRGLIEGVFEFAEADPTAFTYLLSIHHTGVLDHRTEMPAPMRLFVETIQAGIENGAFRALSPVLATGWIVAMAQRAVVFLESDVVGNDRSAVIHNTVDAALRLVAADESE